MGWRCQAGPLLLLRGGALATPDLRSSPVHSIGATGGLNLYLRKCVRRFDAVIGGLWAAETADVQNARRGPRRVVAAPPHERAVRPPAPLVLETFVHPMS